MKHVTSMIVHRIDSISGPVCTIREMIFENEADQKLWGVLKALHRDQLRYCDWLTVRALVDPHTLEDLKAAL